MKNTNIMEKNKYIPPINPKSHYTYEWFFDKYHVLNPQRKINRTAVKNLFESINCIGTRRDLIIQMEKSDLTCYEYLKKKLNEI